MNDVAEEMTMVLANDVQPSDESIASMLEKAMNDEMLAFWQYMTCYLMSRGKGKSDADPEFKEHADEELDHAKKIAQRINELGGNFCADPCEWAPNSNGFTPIRTSSVQDMLDITIDAEKTAIDFYRRISKTAHDEGDFSTNRLAKQILADEEKHLYDLERLKEDISM